MAKCFELMAVAALLTLWPATLFAASHPTQGELEERFGTTVKPFVETYCLGCHNKEKPKGDVDLSGYTTLNAVVHDTEHAKLVLEKLQAEEMPPEKAKKRPTAKNRKEVVEWLVALHQFEAREHAGDPGSVPVRRLSNSEYDYTVRDLTGADIQPAREFPVDPSNTAGFDNSGESLVMSPALLNKYLQAAHEVANHLVLKPNGFDFAPYSMLAETDRDKYCVMRIIEFYHRQNTNYVDYFQAAWAFKHRAALGRRKATLADFANDYKISPKYLATIWSFLEEKKEDIGPGKNLQTLWNKLPVGKVQNETILQGCEQMRDYVLQFRKKIEPRFLNITAGDISTKAEPLLMWKDVQYATHRMTFDPAQLQVEDETNAPPNNLPEPGTKDSLGPGKTKLIHNKPGDADLIVPRGERARYEAAFSRFCAVFPDMFYMEERGLNYFDHSKYGGRYLSAGYHNLMGYFRDDAPLYQLVLDTRQQQELDELWHEMDFIAAATRRTYVQFYRQGARGERALPDDDSSDDKEITSEKKVLAMEDRFLGMAEGGNERGIEAIKDYFQFMNGGMRRTEKARAAAEPHHLDALVDFATRAYRRPLTQDERDDLLAYYHAARSKDGLDHESAMRDSIVSILMSPDFCYRMDLIGGAPQVHALSDYDLANRLSYFLWSSMPDEHLMAHAAKGDLHEPKVIINETRRMLKDPRIRDLVLEFEGNWLDFRRFENITTVDRDRFKDFDNDLREAMFEEPVHFLQDVIQNNRSILDCLYAKDTFVNASLAKHYGMPFSAHSTNDWVQVPDADHYGRGGILPMAAFLTKNAPGLRTSPVKRGYWVVKNVLGERIPPPPPVVPELPRDEAKTDLPLRDMLALHRANPACATCHARFDSMGLVFEGYGPTGERREKDLGGRPVDARAIFPGGSKGEGFDGLRDYVHSHREKDFVNNFCGKLLAFALGRSLLPSDEELIQNMRAKLASNGYRFESAIDAIVTSPQFLTKRGSDAALAEK